MIESKKIKPGIVSLSNTHSVWLFFCKERNDLGYSPAQSEFVHIVKIRFIFCRFGSNTIPPLDVTHFYIIIGV